MSNYEYVNKYGHPYLHNTIGTCNHTDSILVNRYIRSKNNTKNHEKSCACTTCIDLLDLEKTFVIYNTISVQFDSSAVTAFRVKIGNLKSTNMAI